MSNGITQSPEWNSAENLLGVGSVRDYCQKDELVAVAAYFRAEKRGFALGNELGDWYEAENEIGRMIDGISKSSKWRM